MNQDLTEIQIQIWAANRKQICRGAPLLYWGEPVLSFGSPEGKIHTPFPALLPPFLLYEDADFWARLEYIFHLINLRLKT